MSFSFTTLVPMVHILFGASILLTVHAFPLVTRDDPCPTVATGYLAANVSNVAKAVTLNASGTVNYIGDGVDKLAVEFQHCEDSHFPSSEFGYGGIFYVPAKQLCIAMSNQAAASGPYFTELQECNQFSYAQGLFTSDLASYKWSGETDEEGTILQGGCGVLYYRAQDTNGTPFVTTDGIEIVCSSDPTHVETATERSLLVLPMRRRRMIPNLSIGLTSNSYYIKLFHSGSKLAEMDLCTPCNNWAPHS